MAKLLCFELGLTAVDLGSLVPSSTWFHVPWTLVFARLAPGAELASLLTPFQGRTHMANHPVPMTNPC